VRGRGVMAFWGMDAPGKGEGKKGMEEVGRMKGEDPPMFEVH